MEFQKKVQKKMEKISKLKLILTKIGWVDAHGTDSE